MKRKASPSNVKVLMASAKSAGRAAVLRSLHAGLVVCGLENGVLVGRDINTHPLTSSGGLKHDLQALNQTQVHPRP